MYTTLSILAILLAVALPVVDYVALRPRRAAPSEPLGGAERTIYLLFLIAVALMTLSSILLLAVGQPMRGWMLILHMTVAPLFAVAVAALSLMWAGRPSCVACVVLLASFVTILSSMLMMMTWFGSDGQRLLLNTHRVGSMVLLVAAAVQAGRMLTHTPHAARTGD